MSTRGDEATTNHALWCDVLSADADRRAARQLVAAIYLESGYVSTDDVDDAGLLTEAVDPFFRHADYFGVGPGPGVTPLLATSRLISFEPTVAERSFPMLADIKLDSGFLDTVRSADLETWVEVSSLAKRPAATPQAPNLLYRRMWQTAVRERHAVWLFAADYRVSRTLRNLFGDEVTRVGPRQDFMGSATDPLIMTPLTSADWLAQQAVESIGDDSLDAQLVRMALAFFLDGLEPEHFTEEQLERFALGGVELRQDQILDLTEPAHSSTDG